MTQQRIVYHIVRSVIATAACVLPAAVEAADCTPALLNGNCLITISREQPASPLPMRVNSRSTVRIEVSRRPLERILFDVTVADTAVPDPMAAIFAGLLPGMQALALTSRRFPPQELFNIPAKPAPLEPVLAEILEEQQALRRVLDEADQLVKVVAADLRTFRQKPADAWTVDDLSDFRIRFYCSVYGGGGAGDGRTCATPRAGAGTAPLPVGRLIALDLRLKDTIEQFAELEASSRAAVAASIDSVTNTQTQLKASLESVHKAQAELLTAAGIVEAIDIRKARTTESHTIGGFPAHASRTATIKVTAQDVITKETTTLATVVLHWGGTRWEVSAGAIFSALRNRTFENSPIVEGGEPRREPDGKIATRLTETQTRPVVVPMVLAHFRLAEWRTRGQGRFACLLTGGVGINPHAKSADFAAGGTLSYYGLMVSPMLHWVRDVRLTGGLEPGQELGTSPPSLGTERHWVRKLAVGLTYRIPIK